MKPRLFYPGHCILYIPSAAFIFMAMMGAWDHDLPNALGWLAMAIISVALLVSAHLEVAWEKGVGDGRRWCREEMQSSKEHGHAKA